VVSGNKLNPFPPHRVGLWRLRAVPYLLKDRWETAPFGDRWRDIKARNRLPSSSTDIRNQRRG